MVYVGTRKIFSFFEYEMFFYISTISSAPAFISILVDKWTSRNGNVLEYLFVIFQPYLGKGHVIKRVLLQRNLKLIRWWTHRLFVQVGHFWSILIFLRLFFVRVNTFFIPILRDGPVIMNVYKTSIWEWKFL